MSAAQYSGGHSPHPFTDGEPLQGQALRELENKIANVEDRSQPD